jgi:hypothetical protein
MYKAHQTRHEALEEQRGAVTAIGTHRHQFAMRHVDHAHQAEDDGKPQGHEHQNGENAQPGESLHGEHVEVHSLSVTDESYS